MQEISITKFKDRALKLIDSVYQTREELVIRKRGKPVAKIVPFSSPSARFRLGKLAHTKSFIGDIISPVETKWEVLR